jgi:predicted transcriptional regulator
MLPTAEVYTLRSLKKTCIVLLLMIRLDRPVSRNQIAAYLDIHVHTARQYLRQLSAASLIAHTSTGWILTQAGSQLVLPLGGAKITPPMLINNNNRLKDINPQEGANIKGGENNTPPNELPAMWSRLLSYGIDRNPRVEQIVNQPFMTIDYLTSHVAALDRKGYPMPKWAGMLVLQLETGVDPGHEDGCQCEKCLQDYTAGKFSNFIDH